MPAATTLAVVGLGLAAAASTKQVVDSNKAARKAEDAAKHQQSEQLRLENESKKKEEAEKARAAGLQSRQMARSISQPSTTSASSTFSPLGAVVPNSGGKQLIGQ